MLWSLIKILLFVALVAVASWGATALIDAGQQVRVQLGDVELNLGALQAAILVAVALVALWLVLRALGLAVAVIRFVAGDETAISRFFDRSRERRGFAALTEAMLALAAGEGRVALTRAMRAEKLLGRPELTNLVAAQAAEMAGDTARATDIYKRLLADRTTRFVGIRGILRQKLAEGDTATALKLAEKGYALRPRNREMQDTLLRLQAEAHDWKGARRTLEAKVRQGALPRDVHRRRDAVLALQEAREVLDSGNSIAAREAAIEANRKSPDLIPAAVMAARAHIADGAPRKAARLLKKAWSVRPHPDLAAAFAEIAPSETPAERLRRFEALRKLHPDHDETRQLMAELYIAAEDSPAARRALGDLPTRKPTTRVLTIMAAIERGEGSDDAVVRGWLTRALTAPRGPQWVCGECHTVHAQWAPVCAHCERFDTLDWVEVPGGEGPSPTRTEMLPLIVGSAAETAAPADDGHADANADSPAAADTDANAASGTDAEATAAR